MPQSKLTEVKPAVIYDLSEVFAAVLADRDAYRTELDRLPPEWSPGNSGRRPLNAWDRVLDQLTEWQRQGVSQIVTDQPFTDRDFINWQHGTVTEQFAQGRVKPFTPPVAGL